MADSMCENEEEREEGQFEEDIKNDFFALKYFTLSKLHNYEKEIDKMKKDAKEKDEKWEKEVKALKERIRELQDKLQKSYVVDSSSESDQSSPQQWRKFSQRKVARMAEKPQCTVSKPKDVESTNDNASMTPMQKLKRFTQLTPKTPFTVPQYVDDLSSEWAEKLRPMVLTPQKSDLLTEAQLTFFVYWINSRPNLMANTTHTMQLIRDGVEAKVWTRGWSPSGNTTLNSYLMNRLKNVIAKRKRASAISKIKEEFDRFQESTPNTI